MTTPAIAILRSERDRKAQELEQAKSVVRDLQQAVRSIDDALAVLTGQPIADVSTRPAGQEPLKIIIERVLTDRPGLAPSEISAALSALGRPTDVNTVLGTLARAKREGLVHKSGRVWYVGPSESNTEGVMSESEKASVHTEASQQIGDVAELEDHGAVASTQVEQRPISNRGNVGSSPTVSSPSPVAQGNVAGNQSLSGPTHRPPPWITR
jgi:hypothetical protein